MLLGRKFITEFRRSKGYPNGKSFMRDIASLRCDGCGEEFERASSTSYAEKHFCSRKCSNRSGAEQRAQTNLERYGVVCPCSQSHVKARANSVEACAKRHQTMKRNETYRKSSPEDEMYEMLVTRFGQVDRQVPIAGKRWLIDFYLPSINTHVQFDGTYWHGLDRPVELIAEGKTPRDVQIYRKWLADREQDAWFLQQGMRLVRITDVEYKTMGSKVLDKLEVTKWV